MTSDQIKLCEGIRLIRRPEHDDFVYLRFDGHPEWEVRITALGIDTYYEGRHQDYLIWSDLLAIRETLHTAQINERLQEIDDLLYPDRPYPANDKINLGVLMEERRALRDKLVKRVHEIHATADPWTMETRREYNRLMAELGTILAREEKAKESSHAF